MVAVEFSPRCDGCHAVFVASDPKREPVSVGCLHTLCRACAEGDKGAYGALHHLAQANNNEEDSNRNHEARDSGGDEDDGGDEDVRALVQGRCGVCGGGRGGVPVVREGVMQAVREAGGAPVGDVEMCDVCGEDNGGKHPATHFCEECNEHMCDSMAAGHRRMRMSANHTLKTTRSATAPSALHCPMHRQPLLDFFCRQDKCFVCAKCMAGDHNGHAFGEPGAELVGEIREWLGGEVGRAEARAGELEGAETGLVQDREEVVASVRREIDRINAVFAELEKKKRELVSKLVEVRKGTCQRLNDVRTTARTLRQGAEAVRRALQSLADSPTNATLKSAGQVGQQLQQLVEASKQAHTRRSEFAMTFAHSEERLRAWQSSLSVTITDALGSPHEGADEDWEARAGRASSRPLASLNSARSGHAAVVTPTGRVLVVGGFGIDGRLNSVEELGQGDASWQTGLTIPTAREGCGACAVASALIVAGGRTSSAGVCDIVEAVDTVSGAHTTLPCLPAKLRECGVASVQGKVVVTGGWDGSSYLEHAWALEVGTSANSVDSFRMLQWTPLPSMAQARANHGAAAGGGGRVFVCGGENGAPLGTCEALSVVGDAPGGWEALPPMPQPLSEVGCCYGGANLFVVGGSPDSQRSVFAFSTTRKAWTLVAELASGREGCAAVCVGRRVLVLGGYSEDHDGCLGSCEQFGF